MHSMFGAVLSYLLIESINSVLHNYLQISMILINKNIKFIELLIIFLLFNFETFVSGIVILILQH